MTFLPTLALIALPVAGLFTRYVVAHALLPRPRRVVPVILAGAGAALATFWVFRAYQLGVQADATGGRGNIFEGSGRWWRLSFSPARRS